MPRPSHLRTVDLAYIALFAVLMAVCAWITLPFTVPFTLQTFAVFLALTTLGGRRGLYAVAVYLLMGAAGMPVFSGFRGGFGILLGTTGGYLTGFLAAALVYHAITARAASSRPTVWFACIAGLLTCYGTGTLWFRAVYAQAAAPAGLLTILGWCVLPFILPDLAKLALACWLAPRLQKHLK